ncbi:MAG: hypothetical protein IKU98_01065 [Bacteroidaceae bacterium]|nr:hypothetical protein [Bacteroidaceae bacterium]
MFYLLIGTSSAAIHQSVATSMLASFALAYDGDTSAEEVKRGSYPSIHAYSGPKPAFKIIPTPPHQGYYSYIRGELGV